jgi:hypothetical protein
MRRRLRIAGFEYRLAVHRAGGERYGRREP